jgi:hypothetical protein
MSVWNCCRSSGAVGIATLQAETRIKCESSETVQQAERFECHRGLLYSQLHQCLEAVATSDYSFTIRHLRQ